MAIDSSESLPTGPVVSRTTEEESTNLLAVRSAYAAFEAGDLDAFTALMCEDFVSTQSDAVPWRGSHVGESGVRAMFGQVGARASARYVPAEFIDGGDRIVVLGHAEITPVVDGRPRRVRELHVWGVHRGRLISLDVFLNAPQELLVALAS
jgi:ketosteroid isomerase-like protein